MFLYVPAFQQASESKRAASSKQGYLYHQTTRTQGTAAEGGNQRTNEEITVNSRERDTVSLQRVLTEIRKTADSKSPTNCNVQGAKFEAFLPVEKVAFETGSSHGATS